ncbi:NADH dehydrogenase [ubiquinone] 1 alpha subcomplex subunit 3 isoform X2 [Anser cygnoides]
MAGLGRLGAALRTLWAKEPVITISLGITAVAMLSPLVSPFAKYSGMINRATPYAYPVPVRDDGAMPEVPAHPCDKEGLSIEWLKRL